MVAKHALEAMPKQVLRTFVDDISQTVQGTTLIKTRKRIDKAAIIVHRNLINADCIINNKSVLPATGK